MTKVSIWLFICDPHMPLQSDEDAAKNVSSAVSLLKGESKTMRRKEKRARIEQIRVILGLSDSQRTPVVTLYLVLFIFCHF